MEIFKEITFVKVILLLIVSLSWIIIYQFLLRSQALIGFFLIRLIPMLRIVFLKYAKVNKYKKIILSKPEIINNKVCEKLYLLVDKTISDTEKEAYLLSNANKKLRIFLSDKIIIEQTEMINKKDIPKLSVELNLLGICQNDLQRKESNLLSLLYSPYKNIDTIRYRIVKKIIDRKDINTPVKNIAKFYLEKNQTNIRN